MQAAGISKTTGNKKSFKLEQGCAFYAKQLSASKILL